MKVRDVFNLKNIEIFEPCEKLETLENQNEVLK